MRDTCSLESTRVTVVHSMYRGEVVSGENLAVEMQTQALIDAGALVDTVLRSTDEMQESKSYKFASAIRVATGFDPDAPDLPVCEGPNHVLFVHNLFPNFGARAIAAWPGPVLAMVHNYRSVCANGLLFKNGHPCVECISGNSLPSLKYACYRGSRIATLPLAISTRKAPSRNILLTRANRIICQSTRAKSVLEAAGFSLENIEVLPGFADLSAGSPSSRINTNRWLMAGRLSQEKGVLDLVSEWPDDIELDIVGSGPELDELRGRAHKSIRLLGFKPHSWVLNHLGSYEGLVFPGLCFEGAHPMIIREAMARSLPVVAADGTSASDVIQEFGSGVAYNPADGSLESSLRQVKKHRAAFSHQASVAYQKMFTRDSWLEGMRKILIGLTSREG